MCERLLFFNFYPSVNSQSWFELWLKLRIWAANSESKCIRQWSIFISKLELNTHIYGCPFFSLLKIRSSHKNYIQFEWSASFFQWNYLVLNWICTEFVFILLRNHSSVPLESQREKKRGQVYKIWKEEINIKISNVCSWFWWFFSFRSISFAFRLHL